jgi:ribose transport system substrate-binding protein
MVNKQKAISAGLENIRLCSGKIPTRIGYVVNYSFHVWYRVVMEVIKARAAQYGIQEVIINDAKEDLNDELSAIDDLIGKKVDVLIVTPVAAEGVEEIVKKARAAQVPLVLEANPVEGMTTMIAICDYDAGVKGGIWAGEYAKKHFDGKVKLLDIAFPPLRPCLLRSVGFLYGLRSVIPDAELIERVNGLVQIDTSEKIATEVLEKHPDINLIFGMDDESTRGGLNAVTNVSNDPAGILLVGFGMAGDEDKNILLEDGPWKVSIAMFPEWVGLTCVDQAVRLYNGEVVKKHEVTPTIAVSKESIGNYYKNSNGLWIPDFTSIAAIPCEDRCARI